MAKTISFSSPLIEKVPKKQGYTITVGNSKGGVGKTTTTTLLGYVCARMGLKTLVIDTDKQGNMTKTLFNTVQRMHPDEPYPVIQKTFMQGIRERSFKGFPMSIMENLDLIPGSVDTREFSRYTYSDVEDQRERDFMLTESLEAIRFDYDVILIDSPPNHYEVMRNVTLASDYVLVAYQPHEHSMTGAETYATELEELNQAYGSNLLVLGFLPSMVKVDSKNDEYMYAQAVSIFGEENLFDTIVYLRERIKTWDIDGISETKDTWDVKMLQVFKNVAEESLKRLLYSEGLEGEE